jgi:hypothetical protein
VKPSLNSEAAHKELIGRKGNAVLGSLQHMSSKYLIDFEDFISENQIFSEYLKIFFIIFHQKNR